MPEEKPERERLWLLGGIAAFLIAPAILALTTQVDARPRSDLAMPVQPRTMWTVEEILNQSQINWTPAERGGVMGIWTFGPSVRRGRCLVSINGNIYYSWPSASILSMGVRSGQFFQLLNPNGGIYYSFQAPYILPSG